jgi:PPM family protein phosphatase
MGSTLTAMLWSDSHVAVAHVGDSRAYLLRNRVLRQITEDHVLANLVASPMPAQTGEYLVRFLDARPGWSPDLTVRTARPGDRYLICSDGLSGVVDPAVILDWQIPAAHWAVICTNVYRVGLHIGPQDPQPLHVPAVCV